MFELHESKSTGKKIPISSMHPTHLLNHVKKELREMLAGRSSLLDVYQDNMFYSTQAVAIATENKQRIKDLYPYIAEILVRDNIDFEDWYDIKTLLQEVCGRKEATH